MYEYLGNGHFKCTKRAFLEILTLVYRDIIEEEKIHINGTYLIVDLSHLLDEIVNDHNIHAYDRYYISFTEDGDIFTTFLLEEWDREEITIFWNMIYERIPWWYYNDVDDEVFSSIDREHHAHFEQYVNYRYINEEDDSATECSSENCRGCTNIYCEDCGNYQIMEDESLYVDEITDHLTMIQETRSMVNELAESRILIDDTNEVDEYVPVANRPFISLNRPPMSRNVTFYNDNDTANLIDSDHDLENE
jgi:hypothetical protein